MKRSKPGSKRSKRDGAARRRAGLAVFAFYTSLGGQKVFQGSLLRTELQDKAGNFQQSSVTFAHLPFAIPPHSANGISGQYVKLGSRRNTHEANSFVAWLSDADR